MKKMIVFFLAVVLCFGLSACGGSKSTNRCTICGKTATHAFQGSGYCDTHYKDAVSWAMDHTK